MQGAAHPLQLASQQARRPGMTGLPTIAPRPPAYDYYAGLPASQYGNAMQPPFLGACAPEYDYSFGAYPIGDPYAQQRNPLATMGQFPQPQHAEYLPPSDGIAHPGFRQPVTPHQTQQVLPDMAGSQYGVPTAPGHLDVNEHPPMTQPTLKTQSNDSLAPQITDGDPYWSDEEASIAGSDDDGAQLLGSHLRVVLQRGPQGAGYQYSGMDSFSRSANDAALGQYMSTPHADELKHEAKRKLFEHFMRVTGPTMSLYERHPFDPAEKMEVLTNPFTSRDTKGRNIWTGKISQAHRAAMETERNRHLPTVVTTTSGPSTCYACPCESSGLSPSRDSRHRRAQALSYRHSARCKER